MSGCRLRFLVAPLPLIRSRSSLCAVPRLILKFTQMPFAAVSRSASLETGCFPGQTAEPGKALLLFFALCAVLLFSLSLSPRLIFLRKSSLGGERTSPTYVRERASFFFFFLGTFYECSLSPSLFFSLILPFSSLFALSPARAFRSFHPLTDFIALLSFAR